MSKMESNVSIMNRQSLYYAIFILTIFIVSSLYLSWTVDRGMGSITVERLSIEREPGRPVEILIYSPRTEALGGDLLPRPIILTIHGIAGSKEGMYAFNIELARRNFTVISMDLPGHGNSTQPFVDTDVDAMAQDAYYALRLVQTSYPNVDNETYGVICDSFGFRIGIEFQDFPITPIGYVAVGDTEQMVLSQYNDFPGNLLFAVHDTSGDALQSIQVATGNSSAESGVTYGELANQTAYRLATPSTGSAVVSEAITWLVNAVQGETQFLHTLNPEVQIYSSKTIASFLATIFLLLSTLPIAMLVNDCLPERLKPREKSSETQSFTPIKTFLISSILGAVTVITFLGSSSIGIHIENTGSAWLTSMLTTGFVIFYIVGALGLIVTMYLILGKSNLEVALASIGIGKQNLIEHIKDVLKSLFTVVIPVIWILFWLSIAGLPDLITPPIVLAFIKWPVGIKAINTIVLTLCAIPFLLIEAIWIRHILLSKREWKRDYYNIMTILFSLISKFTVASVLTIAYVFGLSYLGLITGSMIMIGYLLMTVLSIQALFTLTIFYTASDFENVWSSVLLVAFILAIVVVSSVPLI